MTICETCPVLTHAALTCGYHRHGLPEAVVLQVCPVAQLRQRVVRLEAELAELFPPPPDPTRGTGNAKPPVTKENT